MPTTTMETAASPAASPIERYLDVPEEVIATALAEKSLYHFVRQAWDQVEAVPYVDNWHIGAITEHLQAVSENQIKKLLINIPPGFSKSLTTCVFWPAWEWTRNPWARWFFASYDQRLSTRDSVKCRALFSTSWYQRRWGDRFKLIDDQNQKTYYETDQGGYRMATSVGGHGTGEHPDRKVIDDPHNVRGAESEAERTSVLDWWDLTMSTRGVSRDCKSVCIMQRLRDDDFSGHVLKEGDWVHICLPMRYEVDRMKRTTLGWIDPRTVEGELLSPRQFDEAKVQAMERPLGSYGVAGQLQQRPVPREGAAFKREWLRYYTRNEGYYIAMGEKRYHIDTITDRFLTIDTAATVKKTVKHDPDYSVISAWGVTVCGLLIWLGCVRFRVEVPDIMPRIAEQYVKHRATRAVIESGGTQKGAYQLAKRHPLSARPGHFMNMVEFVPTTDKLDVATAALAAMEAGRIWLPADDPAFPLAEVEAEILRFTGDPKNGHDDVISTLSIGALQLTRRDDTRSQGFRSQELRGGFDR